MEANEVQTPLLTIGVPVYNAEKDIRRSLDSILGQNFSDFEVLCVDDGSQDRSGQILDEYMRRDSRIRVFHHENHGSSYSRNFVIKSARGTYVSFVDSDDWIDPDHFSNLLQGFNDSTVDMVVSPIKVEKSVPDVTNCRQPDVRNFEIKELTRKETFEAILLDKDVLGYCHGKVFRKDKVQFFFNEKIALTEDLLFCCQYARNIQKAEIVGSPSYHYLCFDAADVLLKSVARISALKAYILILEILSEDSELTEFCDIITNVFLRQYYCFVAHYSQVKNREALAKISEYKSEIRKYLHFFRSSPRYGFTWKLKQLTRYYFPYTCLFVRRIFKFT